jgi:hypothetical protein
VKTRLVGPAQPARAARRPNLIEDIPLVKWLLRFSIATLNQLISMTSPTRATAT